MDQELFLRISRFFVPESNEPVQRLLIRKVTRLVTCRSCSRGSSFSPSRVVEGLVIPFKLGLFRVGDHFGFGIISGVVQSSRCHIYDEKLS